MHDITRRKLDQIDALYPAERLAASKARWTRLWHGEAPTDRYPFTFAPLGVNYYAGDQEPERSLHAQLDEIIARGEIQDDFIPSFFPGCRQSTMPSLFGAAEVIIDGDYSCERLETLDLPAPDFGPGTVAHRWLEIEAYVLEETEGRLPIHPADSQGPADVCGKLFGYEALLAAAYDEPERYHAVMGQVTDAFITYWEAQRRVCGDRFVGTHLWAWNWVPADAGASISVDSLVMISPDFYTEFYQPHLQRIGEAFGGMAVHACGDFAGVVRAVCATPTMKAVNAGEMTVSALHDAGMDAHTIIIAGAGLDTLDDVFARIRTDRLRVDLNLYGLWPWLESGLKPTEAWDADDCAAMARIFDRVQALATDTAASWR